MLALVVASLGYRLAREVARANRRNRIANISHQLFVQPEARPDTSGRYYIYSINLLTTNDGPATAQQFITELYLRVPTLILAAEPRVLSDAPGAEVQILRREPPGFYQILVKTLQPAAGSLISAAMYVPDSLRDRVLNDWHANMFAPTFVRHFVTSMETYGENVNARNDGAYRIK